LSIAAFFVDHPFFQQRNMQTQVIEELLNVMKLKRMPEKAEVFEIGSLGDLFYFIIEGVVEVRIPDFENK
jgi:CRP-like cAMP-binding protein